MIIDHYHSLHQYYTTYYHQYYNSRCQGNENKACGPDLISHCLLKEDAIILSWTLLIILNRSLEQGNFPSCWKYGNVTPIYKKDDKSALSNYRPITLFSSLGKAMERCAQKYLYNYIIGNTILTPFQSGFVRCNSTTNQLLHTYHTFCNAVDSGKDVWAVFVTLVSLSTGYGIEDSSTNIRHMMFR